MATRSSQLGAILYGTETTFGDTGATTATRLTIMGEPDFAPVQELMDPDIYRQRPHDAAQGILMPKSGTVTFEMLVTGLGSTTTTTPPVSALVTLLGAVFGQTSVSHTGTNITSSGGTASAATVTAASGIAAGSVVRVGVKGDGRADGQWAAVSTHASSTLNLLTALPAATSGTDQVYASRMVYESETTGTYETITSLRIRFLTGRQQYLAHGCYPTAVEFSGLNPGEVPRVRLTFTMAWWEEVSGTFPDSTSIDNFTGSPNAGGSFFWNDVGTATRVTESIRAFRWNIGLNQLPQFGPNGNNVYQTLVDCIRGPSTHTFEIEYDAEAAGTNTQGALVSVNANSRINRHFLYSMSVGDGRAVALYVRNAKFTGSYPVQRAVNGVLRHVVSLQATPGTTATSDLTLSAWVLAMA
jgi:hypothetical protein